MEKMNQTKQTLHQIYRDRIMKNKENDTSYKDCTLVKDEQTLRFQHPKVEIEEIYQLEKELTGRLQQQTNYPVIGMHHRSFGNDLYYFFVLQKETHYYGATFIGQGEHKFLYSIGTFDESFNMQVNIGGKRKNDYSFLYSLTENTQAWIAEQPMYRLLDTTGLLQFKEF